jgi:XisI protein
MAKVEQYRQLVQELLTARSEIDFGNPDLESELILDTIRDRYQLVHVGWSDEQRIYGCSLHLDIRAEKFGFNMMAQRAGSPRSCSIVGCQSKISSWPSIHPLSASLLSLPSADFKRSSDKADT